MGRQTNSAICENPIEFRGAATNSAEAIVAVNENGAPRVEEANGAVSTTAFMIGCALAGFLILSSSLSASTATEASSVNRYSLNPHAVGSSSTEPAFVIEAEPLGAAVEPAASL